MVDDLIYQDEPWNELINGNLVKMSPRPSTDHNIVVGNIFRIFGNYLDGSRCTPFAAGSDLFLTEQNRFIPDGMIVCDMDKIKPDGIHGAPDLVVEVLSPSTVKNDRGHKKDVYEASGVKEYWIVDTASRSIEVHLLKDGKFDLDNVYSVYPDFLLRKMTEEERSQIINEFHPSEFPEMTVSLDAVFAGLIEGGQ